jgi:H+/Cl- antiporter ClcA
MKFWYVCAGGILQPAIFVRLIPAQGRHLPATSMKAIYGKILSVLRRIWGRIRNEKLKQNLLQAIPFWTASLITGLVAVVYARGFALAESASLSMFSVRPWLVFVVTPLCFFLAWWLVRRFAPFARGSGIPQVMASIELANPRHKGRIRNLLSLRVILIKIISSLVLVVGGGAIGREGPTIQVAGSVFRKIDQLLPEWWPKVSKKNMIMTGAAAGLAAAFNTPLGGIVFAVEELTKMHISYFKAAIFTAVIIAGLTAQGMLGSYLYLGFPVVNNISYLLLFGVALVALVAGLSGSVMARVLWLLLRWKARLKGSYRQLAYLLVCSLALAALAYFVSQSVLGSGKALLTQALFTDDKYAPWYMPLLRILGPIFSFTSGAAGGIFAPGLSAGGTIGSAISSWFLLPPSDTNVMILAGMVAFLTGITRAPFTSAILVLEMTDRNNLILHLMLAGMLANFVSVFVDRRSVYDYLKEQYMQEALEAPLPPDILPSLVPAAERKDPEKEP